MSIVSNPDAFRMHRREQLFHYAKWLRAIPFQLFATLTFGWRVSDPQAVQVFKVFIDRLETYFRCPICFLRGDEKRFSGCGKPSVPRHFHVLLAAAVRLDPVYVHDTWAKLGGGRKHGAGADVRVYDPEQDALKYTLKFALNSDANGHFADRNFGDWNFGNLDLFLRKDSTTLNARARRRMSRQVLRMQQAQDVLRVASVTGGLA